MCAVCSTISVPICGSGIICAGNWHAIASFILLSGSAGVGSLLGMAGIRSAQKSPADAVKTDKKRKEIYDQKK